MATFLFTDYDSLDYDFYSYAESLSFSINPSLSSYLSLTGKDIYIKSEGGGLDTVGKNYLVGNLLFQYLLPFGLQYDLDGEYETQTGGDYEGDSIRVKTGLQYNFRMIFVRGGYQFRREQNTFRKFDEHLYLVSFGRTFEGGMKR